MLKPGNENKAHIHISGVVVRCDAEGLGIGFDEDYKIKPFLKRGQ